MSWDHTRWKVTRKTLPSGRVVDIVVQREQPKPMADLTLCPATDCSGKLCYPIRWTDLDPGGWCLVRRCPDCQRAWHGHHAHENVERYDTALQAGTDQLITDLEQLARRNQAEWSARFISALNHDALLPFDF